MPNVRLLTDDLALALVAEHNKRFRDLQVLKAGTIFHAHPTSLVTAADGDGTLAKLKTLTLALCVAFNEHCASECDATSGVGTHLAADATNAPVTATALADLAACNTRLNSLYTAYNAHLTQAGKHCTNDATNAASSASATDQSSADTRANDIKAKMNLHIAAAMAAGPIVLVGP